MKTRYYFTLLLFNLLLLFSCNSNNEDIAPINDDSLSTIRMVDGNWEANDAIGVFFVKDGANLNDPTDILYENIKYEYDNSTPSPPWQQSGYKAFKINSANVPYYPVDDSKIQAIAYYPYNSSWSSINGIYNIDVSNQSKQQDIDLLYAPITTGNYKKTNASNPINLDFYHKLSRLILDIKAGEGVSEDDIKKDLTIELNNYIYKGVFSLATGNVSPSGSDKKSINPYKATSASSGHLVRYEAILIPQTTSSIDFFIGTTKYSLELKNSKGATLELESGTQYVYSITITKTTIIIEGEEIVDWGNTNNSKDGQVNPYIEFVDIRHGTFWMGSEVTHPIGVMTNNYQKNVHKVTLSKDFKLSTYPITNRLFAYFLNAYGVGADGKSPIGKLHATQPLVKDCITENEKWGVTFNSITNKWVPAPGMDEHPAVWLSWYGADAFAKWYGGRLPTEAEWEYACWADLRKDPYILGSSAEYATPDGTNLNLGDYMWITDSTKPVGGKDPNKWGLHDMMGNITEWINDNFDLYTTTDAIDPNPAGNGSGKVLRGSNPWNTMEEASSRYVDTEEKMYAATGFRIAMDY